MAFQEYDVKLINFQRVITHSIASSGFIPPKGSEIYVKNLPNVVSDEDLIGFFKNAGNVYKIRIMMNEGHTENRGYCYVSYFDPTAAKNAVITLKNKLFKNTSVLILENSLDNCRIFMGGIPTNKTKDQVWQALIKFGIKDIVDVIMYRSYTDRAKNRGFVFVEFKTHENAARFRAKYSDILNLWGCPIIIDWSVPIPEVEEEKLQQVKIVYLKNLSVTRTPQELENLIHRFVVNTEVEKVFKFKDYAFIHLTTRKLAEHLMCCLKEYFKNDVVEVEWAKPTTRWTSPEYRQLKVSMTRSRTRIRTASLSSEELLNSSVSPQKSERFVPSPESVRERNNLRFATKRCNSNSTLYKFQDRQTASRGIQNDNLVQNNCIPQPSFVNTLSENDAINENFSNMRLSNSNMLNGSSSSLDSKTTTNSGGYQIFDYQRSTLGLYEFSEREGRQCFMDNRHVLKDERADNFSHHYVGGHAEITDKIRVIFNHGLFIQEDEFQSYNK